MKSFALFTQGQSAEQLLSAAGFWQFVASLFCLPANLLIEFVSSNKTLASVVQWSIPPDALLNSWSAACASFVVWILIVAFIAGTNK
jgi:hypothetical protein